MTLLAMQPPLTGWIPVSAGPTPTALSPFTRRFRELTAGQRQEDIGRRLGYSGARIGQIQRGERPGREFVERLITAYELARDEWLELSGYGAPPEPSAVDETMVRSVEEAMRRMGLAGKSGAEAFVEGLSALQQELGRPLLLRPKLEPGLTVEAAEKLIADIRQQAEEGVF